MPLETATYISQLVSTNPAHTDGLNQADSHLRLLKSVLQAQFPAFTAAALASTQAQLDAAVTAIGALTHAQLQAAVDFAAGGGFIGFSANNGGTNTTLASTVPATVPFSTELYDVGAHFAANAWTPPAGKVHLDLHVGVNIEGMTNCQLMLLKNGVTYKTSKVSWQAGDQQRNIALHIGLDDIANGTDVYTAQLVSTFSAGGTITGDPAYTYFTGHWIAA